MYTRCLLITILCLAWSFGFAGEPLHSKIPPYIWQTYKTSSLPLPAVEARQTWVSLNPEFNCLFFDDVDIERYIQQKWPSDFLDFFHALPIGAMKADLWRYLILASDGGVYSDIDSICLKPIRTWPLEGKSSQEHALFLDLDLNQDHFCQWTLIATPKHPALQYVCRYLLKQWKKRGLLQNSDGTIDVLGSTGPAIFSDAIKKYIDEPKDLPACKISKEYFHNKDYRKRLQRLGIFFLPKGFLHGQGAKNLFWGSSQCLGDTYESWGKQIQEFKDKKPRK